MCARKFINIQFINMISLLGCKLASLTYVYSFFYNSPQMYGIKLKEALPYSFECLVYGMSANTAVPV